MVEECWTIRFKYTFRIISLIFTQLTKFLLLPMDFFFSVYPRFEYLTNSTLERRTMFISLLCVWVHNRWKQLEFNWIHHHFTIANFEIAVTVSWYNSHIEFKSYNHYLILLSFFFLLLSALTLTDNQIVVLIYSPSSIHLIFYKSSIILYYQLGMLTDTLYFHLFFFSHLSNQIFKASQLLTANSDEWKFGVEKLD